MPKEIEFLHLYHVFRELTANTTGRWAREKKGPATVSAGR